MTAALLDMFCGLNGRDLQAAIGEGAAEAGGDERLADIGAGAHEHDGAGASWRLADHMGVGAHDVAAPQAHGAKCIARRHRWPRRGGRRRLRWQWSNSGTRGRAGALSTGTGKRLELAIAEVKFAGGEAGGQRQEARHGVGWPSASIRASPSTMKPPHSP